MRFRNFERNNQKNVNMRHNKSNNEFDSSVFEESSDTSDDDM